MGISPLKIKQLSLAGEGAWPDLRVDTLSPTLNVFYGLPRSGKSSVAQIVGHLMYGKSESPWRRQFGQAVASTEGSLHLEGPQGDFVLRRHLDANRQSRLTISSGQGDAVDGTTIQNLLGGLSPQLAAKVFLVDFAESPRADWLLSETFAREFSGSSSAKLPREASRPHSCCAPAESSIVDRVDRRRIDELVNRRDTIAGEIQQQMSVRRGESEVLEREIHDVDAELGGKREHVDRINSQLRRVETELAELETRLRYFSLDQHSKQPGQSLDVEQQQKEIAELDEEITRCRRSLMDLQRREDWLRTELAQISPDGTADSVTCLADGRSTLGALEQLLDDLDAEISQLARANEPGRCIGHDSHAKLSPMAALMRQQVYTLCGQLTEQERIVRRQQLTTESRQLARVHTELGERLDLLLSGRESLIRSSQHSGQPARLVPQPPAAQHCHCEHHSEFVQLADAMVLGRADRGQHESDARSQLGLLQRDRAQLLNELNALQVELDQLATRWENLQRERAGLIGCGSLEEQQAELERLESVIQQSLHSAETQTASSRVGVWRASDILAQLTNGHLVQVRLERHHSQATIVDRHGQPRSLEGLSASEHDQLYLALTLSLVNSYAQRGIHLPLVLDEPFLQQNPAQAASMAGVLDEFARAGHQLLVFTEDREAHRRFATLSVALFDLEAIRQTKTTHQQVATAIPQPMFPTTQTTNTRIVRETYDGHSTPPLRLATVSGGGEGDSQPDDVFYLTESSSFRDFPVLGADTSMLFSRIEINSVGDLLAANAADIFRRLNLDGITAETVSLWQIHMGLMCHVPNLTLEDAQVLAASGIDSPASLLDADIESLLRSIEQFLRSERGRQFERSRKRYDRARLSSWRTGASQYRDRWQASRRQSSHGPSRQSKRASKAAPRTDVGRGRPRKTRPPQRFYLSRVQRVEDAPSIGPKTATRLEKVGIRTVADLLHADPESTATELNVSHINADTLAAWQHQARLVCQIPELRGYGAQLLVACGMTRPAQIAGMDPNDLVERVLSFCQTKEGQRILRSSNPPEGEKIAEWVELAMLSRPVEAA